MGADVSEGGDLATKFLEAMDGHTRQEAIAACGVVIGNTIRDLSAEEAAAAMAKLFEAASASAPDPKRTFSRP